MKYSNEMTPERRFAKKVSVVIPAFNEAGNLPKLVERLTHVFKGVDYDYGLIFVDDGSSDTTEEVLMNLHDIDSRINYLSLSRNFGHQNALKAGLDYADGDCIISMDCDLQHPPELLPTFIHKWEEGYEIVYSRRKSGDETSFIKKKTSNLFYSISNNLSEVKMEPGTADFRLIDRKVADALIQFKEIDPFLRGIIKWVGFKQYAIDYKPDPRFAGKSKYSFKKMIQLAFQGITSFSIRPLYLAVYLGFTFSLVSLLYIPYVLFAIYNGVEVAGWASVIMTIVFFGGLNLIIMGIIGIYVGKMFLQTKMRPNYLIQRSSLQKVPNGIVKF